jgi:polysaccharide chain length determinant protein (PEP-CTERM system associated)
VNRKLDPILDDVRGAWRYRWWALGVAVAVAVVGWLIIFALPDRYEAGAVVLVDRTVLKPALQGLAVEQDVNVQLNYVRQSLIAGPHLLKVAQTAGVLPTPIVDPGEQERRLNNLEKRIQLTVDNSAQNGDPNSGGVTYRIAYQDADRERALRFVTILLQTLVEETLGGKVRGSENAQQFLSNEVQEYEKRLRSAEDQLAAFKSQHLGLMPSEKGGYFDQLQKESQDIEDTKTKLITAQSRRSTLERQLHGDTAVSAAGSLPGVAGLGATLAGTDTLSQIAQMQAHLDELLLKYTDNHPDVIAARQTLADLKRRREAEIEALRHGDANAAATSGASANPVFQSIQLALNQADVEISDLRSQLAEHESKARELRRLLDTAPQIEAEYAQLNRDYDVNKTQYTALLSSFEKARLGERADNAGSVRFEIVQPPNVGYFPASPKRTALIALVLFVGVVAGGVAAYALSQLYPVVGSATGLSTLIGIPVLGAVGSAFPSRANLETRAVMWRFSSAVGVFLVAFAVVEALSLLGLRIVIPALQQMVST